MKDINVKSLDVLRKTCYNGGLLPIFLGILIIFINSINKNLMQVLVGIFIFINGYAFVKISAKLKNILREEGVLDLDKT